MKIYTIGFTGKSAEEFFKILLRNGIKKVIDIRLNNVSQLAGFTKAGDFEYFLREIGGISYEHEPLLAPTKDMLGEYRKNKDWNIFQERFTALMAERQPENIISPERFDSPTALLCSEPTAEKCHRRLVAERLASNWRDVEIIHL